MQLFDIQLVCEMITAAIILHEAEKNPNVNINENEVADFVIKYFPQIIDIVTSTDKDDDNNSD